MKVLHVVAGNLNGGAARGAYWLHLGLIEKGVDSRVLINRPDPRVSDRIITTAPTRFRAFVSKVLANLDRFLLLFYPKRRRLIFNSGLWGVDITKTQVYQEADIIHLHWINGGFLSIKTLGKIKKPIVWTLRDMWPMTGGCHLAEALGCDRYRSGCGECVQLNSSSPNDLTKKVVDLKLSEFPKDIKVVAISEWLASCAKRSRVFKGFDVRAIDNNIDTTMFYSVDKQTARKRLKIDTEKHVVVIGSSDIHQFYKGFDKLLEALRYLDSGKYLLVFFGSLTDEVCEATGFEYLNIGNISDDDLLREVYASGDVFVAPSIMDAFGKTLAESMACGTPVVCFDATGPGGIVSHKVDGYKAKPFEPEDLARGVEWVCQESHGCLSKRASDNAVIRFSKEVVATQYKDIYRLLVEEQ